MINDQILKKEETIIAKRAIAKAIHEKFIGIKHLINRNREVHEPH